MQSIAVLSHNHFAYPLLYRISSAWWSTTPHVPASLLSSLSYDNARHLSFGHWAEDKDLFIVFHKGR